MKQICLFLLAGLIFCSGPASAARYNPQTCPTALRKAALKDTYEIQSWADMHQLYQRYQGCDAAAVASNFSYNVVQLMTRKWGRMKILTPLLKADPDFQAFIIDHITYATTQLQRRILLDNIRHGCPPGTAALCQGIKDQLDSIIVHTDRFKTD